MLSKLLKMHNRYIEIHLSSSRGRVAKSIKIHFFPLIFITISLISLLTYLILFTIFYYQSIDEVIYSQDVDKYIKDRLSNAKVDIDFIDPIKNENAIISQGIQDGHHGIDIATEFGDKIFSSATGQVIYTGNDAIYGNIIILSHQNNFYTFYGHLDTILVDTHNFVKSGDILGYVGESGIAKGPHLHFEIWNKDGFVDPLKMSFNIPNINNKD